MPDDEVRITSLYAGFSRSMTLLGLLLSMVWLFAAFSYFLSKETGADWFSRSGSLMALCGGVISFRAMSAYQSKLMMALREGLLSVTREIELTLEPPQLFRLILYLGYLTGIIGTAIWGYGDLLLRPGCM
jgi:hypothetical protein